MYLGTNYIPEEGPELPEDCVPCRKALGALKSKAATVVAACPDTRLVSGPS